MTTDTSPARHTVVIVGGGTAGIGLASALLRRDPALDIAVVEPSDDHCYQPALTLVGAGYYPLEKTMGETAAVMPAGVTWLREAAAVFDARARTVELANGQVIGYEHLVLCPGLECDWSAIDGLTETLGRNGVTSNYHPQTAAYTSECLREFKGERALFTQPAMPIKCPGAPQKIAYLAADRLRRQGRLGDVDIQFCLAGDKLFSVDAFVEPLLAVAERYGIRLGYRKELVAVEGDRRTAHFRVSDGAGGHSEVSESFDLLHAVPPQRAPSCIRHSAFANEQGFVAVDHGTLQHPEYETVFALGDAAGTPNSKTAAAVRAQIPVVRDNLLAAIAGRQATARYDGYGACPLTTAKGRVILAEFGYGGVLKPSFPVDPTRERRSMWHFKRDFLPWFYWQWLLKGRPFATAQS
ncbi:FAD-dependent oxidoreductase [Arhodomonas sp. AD133]|uniref:NAD(P)/FAD-dependent oxidoreductase n=1 Tax=Arhodomonas sp. AD133 TaxID=3415009 RepID=UPI003EB92770